MTTENAQAVSPMLRWIVAVAFFMQMLDGTIMNTALPGIAQDLMVPPLSMQSAVIAYMLTTALFIPASGWLADRFGTQRVFILAVFLFSLGSLLCAASQSLNILVLSRVVQGLGGALMVPVGRLVIVRAYPRKDLVRILSFVTIPGLIGPLVGPMAGGFLVEYASWHWIFLINIPVGVVGIFLAWRCMPNLTGTNLWKFDFPGFLLFGLSMVLVTFSMEGLGELHLPKVQVTLLCTLGLMLLGFYWLRALRVEHPLFEPRIFRVRSFAVGIIGNLFARLGSGGVPFLMPLFLQLGLDFSPFFAGVTMIPTALAGIVGKGIINKLVEKMGFRAFLTVNTLMVGAHRQLRPSGREYPIRDSAHPSRRFRDVQLHAVHGHELRDPGGSGQRKRRCREQPSLRDDAGFRHLRGGHGGGVAQRFQRDGNHDGNPCGAHGGLHQDVPLRGRILRNQRADLLACAEERREAVGIDILNPTAVSRSARACCGKDASTANLEPKRMPR